MNINASDDLQKCESFSAAKRFLFFSDHRTLSCHFSIERREVLPLSGKIVFVKNCLNRAFRDACFTINALIRMNVKDLVSFIKAFDGADHHAISVFASKTRFSDDVRHG